MPYGRHLVDHNRVSRVPIVRLDSTGEISSDDSDSVKMIDQSLKNNSNNNKKWLSSAGINFGNMFNTFGSIDGHNLMSRDHQDSFSMLKNYIDTTVMEKSCPVVSNAKDKFCSFVQRHATMNRSTSTFHPAIVASSFEPCVSSESHQIFIPRMTYCNLNRCYQPKYKQKYFNKFYSNCTNSNSSNSKKHSSRQSQKKVSNEVKHHGDNVESSQKSETVQLNDKSSDSNKIGNSGPPLTVECHEDKCDIFEKVADNYVVNNWLDLCTDDESDEANNTNVPDSWDEEVEHNTKGSSVDIKNSVVKTAHVNNSEIDTENKVHIQGKKCTFDENIPQIRVDISSCKTSKIDGDSCNKNSVDDKSFVLLVRKDSKKCRPSAKKRRRSKAKKTEEENERDVCQETSQKNTPKCQNSVAFMFGFNPSDIGDSNKETAHSFYMTFENDDQISDWSEDEESEECEYDSLSEFDEFKCPLNLSLICSVKQPQDDASKELKDINLAWEIQISSSSQNCDARRTKKCGKKVHFPEEDKIAEVHHMIAWSHAYEHARKGPWHQYALDHERFQKRIEDVGKILMPILLPEHRQQIYKSLTKS